MSYRERVAKRRGTVLLGAAAAGALMAATPGCSGSGRDVDGGDPCAQFRLPDGGLQFFCCGVATDQYFEEEKACQDYIADGGK
jgi:hypothetical protein